MDIDYMLDDGAWRRLLEGVAARFDELTIIRGFQYYKQGRVEELALRDDGVHVDARVKDNRMYDVAVDLDDLAASECACSANRACTHMAATLMRYAELCGRPIQALANARSALKSAPAIGKPDAGRGGTRTGTARAAAEAPSLERNASEEGANRFAVPATAQPVRPTLTETELTEFSVAKWHERFEKRLGAVHPNIRTAQEAGELLADLQAMRPELPWALEQLFTLHALLFVLELVVKPNQADWRQSRLFMGYHTKIALDGLLDQARNLLEDKLALADDSSLYWHHLMGTADFLRTRMMTEEKSLGCFAALHASLWLHWLSPDSAGSAALYEKELRKLQAAEAALGTSLSRQPWKLAQCLLLLYLARDTEARSMIVRDGVNLKPEHLTPLFGVLERSEQWARLRDWLAETGPLLGSSRSEDLAPYGNYWAAVVAQLPEAEATMWLTLQEMLPYSRTVYEDALAAHGRWDRWIDLQMCMGQDPLSFRVTALKPVEKEAPEMLLPFYHQAVERYVLQKNRDGYKAATKLLKRLAKLYSRLKKGERWEQFITAFAVKNSRLRALQEELRKGGLLS
ncbi:hypothetical protein EV294_105425 [Paenibacillus sp. BK033]|nr:hypothetical protein EV294_105425 [Paenibacillus sp. BK033]